MVLAIIASACLAIATFASMNNAWLPASLIVLTVCSPLSRCDSCWMSAAFQPIAPGDGFEFDGLPPPAQQFRGRVRH